MIDQPRRRFLACCAILGAWVALRPKQPAVVEIPLEIPVIEPCVPGHALMYKGQAIIWDPPQQAYGGARGGGKSRLTPEELRQIADASLEHYLRCNPWVPR